jgi:PAS domain S-box-containing protein
MDDVSARLSDPANLLAHLGAYVYAKDRRGVYTYANDLVCKLFGREMGEVVGHDDSAFFDLERSKDLKDNDDQVMDSGQTVTAREIDIVRETGQERVFWTVKTPLTDSAGVVIGLVGLSVDITQP